MFYSLLLKQNTITNQYLLTTLRFATKKAGGSVRNGRDSIGKHLGIKKYGGEYVIPGNIIIRQRGFRFHPGENVGTGVDHTIYSLITGYVNYTKDKISKRQFINVSLVNPNIQQTKVLDPNFSLKDKLIDIKALAATKLFESRRGPAQM